MRRISSFCTTVTLLAVAWAAWAQDEDFLPAEDAYQYEVSAENGRILVSWIITPGYYLYRERMEFESATSGVSLGRAVFPKAETHHDEYVGDAEIYRGTATFELPYKVSGKQPAEVTLKLKWQGCADAGLCYPPTTWKTRVKLPPQSGHAKDRTLPSAVRGQS